MKLIAPFLSTLFAAFFFAGPLGAQDSRDSNDSLEIIEIDLSEPPAAEQPPATEEPSAADEPPAIEDPSATSGGPAGGEAPSAVGGAGTVEPLEEPSDLEEEPGAPTPAADGASPRFDPEPLQDDAPAPGAEATPDVVIIGDDEPAADEAVETLDLTETEMPVMTLDMTQPGGPTFGDQQEELAEGEMADKISVDFPDEEVRNIIRSVADLYNLNVVIPDDLVGSTSIKLQDVTWQQVFDVVLDPLGFTYVIDDNIIKIKSRADIVEEPVEMRVFDVNFAKASEISSVITPLVDATRGGRIQVDQRTNVLIVTERPSKIGPIQSIIQRLDKPTSQVMIESKFIEVTDGDTRNLGLDWSSLDNYTVFSASNLQRSFNQNYTQTRNDGETNTETSDSASQSGVTIINGNPTFTTSQDSNSEVQRTLEDSITNTRTITRATSAVFSAGDFELVLSALQSNTDSRVVTNPTVVTLDGEEAKIVIGQQYPIPNYQYNPDLGTFEVSGFEFRDIGVVLDVRPQVNSAGFIRLDIEPEISSIESTVAFSGAAQAIPVIGTTVTKSSVMIKDGFTLAIGGLLETRSNSDDNGVPYLSEIPLFGRLFRRDSDANQESNLIIFITARALNPDGTTYKEIVDPRVLARMGILESELPGYHHRMPEEQVEVMNNIQEMRNEAAREAAMKAYRKQLEVLEKAREKREEKADRDRRVNAGELSPKHTMPRSRAR